MPLKTGKSPKVISYNIKKEMSSGKPQKAKGPKPPVPAKLSKIQIK